MVEIRLLHLTDLHAGMPMQAWLWPRFRADLMEDLAKVHEKSGPWDTIIFSGDLVRTGAQDEYQRFNDILHEIVLRCRQLGSTVEVISTPGNHDLSRPSAIDPHFISLGQLSANELLQKDFWADDKAGNRSFVNSLFENYYAWRALAIDQGIHSKPIAEGPIIGDAAYEVKRAGATMRVCSLNSTWMQLSEGEYKGRLIVDPMQLFGLTSDNPDNWLAQAHFSALVTHQPSSWLTKPSFDLWQSDIYTPDRFDVHMFGHMHQPASTSYSAGGAPFRRDIQGPSLFGYEKTDFGWERIQGYAVHRINDDHGSRQLESWPRKLVSLQSGNKKLRPDTTFDIDEDTSSYFYDYRRLAPVIGIAPNISPAVDAFEVAETNKPFGVKNLEVSLRTTASHDSVRAAEQAAALAAWQGAERGFWLRADWGLGAYQFIASVQKKAGLLKSRIYKINAAQFVDRNSFLEQIRVSFGVTYEEICDLIEKSGPCILIFDDALSAAVASDTSYVTEQLEGFISATKDYLPNSHIVIASRILPVEPTLPVVELKPLDEPDTRAYVASSESEDSSLTSEAAIEKLHKLTDGHPGRLDAALRQLQVVALSELAMTNSDLVISESLVNVPAALSDAVTELRSTEGIGERAFGLLCALAAFPNGEQLDRVKRFNDKSQFFPQHATALLERNLIDSVSYRKMGEKPGIEDARLLSVPRPVREYVRGISLSSSDQDIDQKAIILYFGENWKSGIGASTIASHIAENPLAAPHELANANTLLTRLVRKGLEHDNKVDVESAIRVTATFISKQMKGGHYRSALSLCDDILPLIAGVSDEQEKYIKTERARCLRMVGKSDLARDQYLEIDMTTLSRSLRQETYLGLALSQWTLGDNVDAIASAQLAVDLNPKSLTAHHARIQLAQMKPYSSERTAELIDLRNKASARKWLSLVNNVNLFLANRQEQAEKKKSLRAVIDSSLKSKDFYNKFRAVLALFEDRSPGETVLYADRLTLLSAYHFFHNERMSSQFEKVHTILWNLFEEEADLHNLLSLFRHSSFIWRLAGNVERENAFLKRLKKKVDQIRKSNLPNIHRDRVYFLTRISIVVLS